jgi:hypothetical protein
MSNGLKDFLRTCGLFLLLVVIVAATMYISFKFFELKHPGAPWWLYFFKD